MSAKIGTTSKYRGVTVAKNGRYSASAFLPGQVRVYLGTWTREVDAALARDRAVLHLKLDRTLNFSSRAKKLGPASPKELLAQARKAKQGDRSSQYFGVVWDESRGRWICSIGLRGGRKGRLIARFEDARDAAIAYDRVAKHLFGTDALLNFPERRLKPATSKEMQVWARALWKERVATSRYRGVYWSQSRSRWVAQIGHSSRHRSLGLFDSEVEAAEAYDREARKLKGSEAKLNFP